MVKEIFLILGIFKEKRRFFKVLVACYLVKAVITINYRLHKAY